MGASKATRGGALQRANQRTLSDLESLEPRILCAHTLIIGHRGNSGIAPENTLASLNQAFLLGADVVEADIHVSADGIPVLMHDSAVDRTTDGSGIVAELTVEQLKLLDAGSWKSASYTGELVPTVTEALEAAAGRGPVYLDLKVDGLGGSIQAILADLKLPDTAVWASANTIELVTDIREHLPNTPILWWGTIPKKPNEQYFQSMHELGVTGFDLRWGEFSRGFARSARAAGMFFSTYTLNSPRELRAALRLDLDAIETDFPGLLADIIAARSGSVRAQLASGLLDIQGDALDNNIRIERGSTADSLRVTGMHGTRINGQSLGQEFSGVRDLRITLDKGDDTVRLIELTWNGEFELDTGHGDDFVALEAVQFSGTHHWINSGKGSDWFESRQSAVDSLLIDGGSGRDHATRLPLASLVDIESVWWRAA